MVALAVVANAHVRYVFPKGVRGLTFGETAGASSWGTGPPATSPSYQRLRQRS